MKEERGPGLQRPSVRPPRLLIDKDCSPYTPAHDRQRSPSVDERMSTGSAIADRRYTYTPSPPSLSPRAYRHVADIQAQRGSQDARQNPLARKWNVPRTQVSSLSQSPQQEQPSSRRSVRLLPTDEWNQMSNKETHSSHDEVANPSGKGVESQSPDGEFIRNAAVSPSWSSSQNFLTPGDPKTMHIQVKELEAEVCQLAQQLYESQEESSRLRKALEQERNRSSYLSSDYERHLEDQMRDTSKSKAEVLSCKTEITQLRTTIIDLQADIMYKDLQRTQDVLELTGRHAMMAWKGHMTDMRRRLRASCKTWVRKMMSRLLWCWRIVSSCHVALLNNYAHRLLEVRHQPRSLAPFVGSFSLSWRTLSRNRTLQTS